MTEAEGNLEAVVAERDELREQTRSIEGDLQHAQRKLTNARELNDDMTQVLKESTVTQSRLENRINTLRSALSQIGLLAGNILDEEENLDALPDQPLELSEDEADVTEIELLDDEAIIADDDVEILEADDRDTGEHEVFEDVDASDDAEEIVEIDGGFEVIDDDSLEVIDIDDADVEEVDSGEVVALEDGDFEDEDFEGEEEAPPA